MRTMTLSLLLAGALLLQGCAALSPLSYSLVHAEAIAEAERRCECNGGLDVIRFKRGYYPRTLVYEGACVNGLAFFDVEINKLPGPMPHER